jgi:CRP/FNR family transcriptional regulator, cyclic AMP receptor protein
LNSVYAFCGKQAAMQTLAQVPFFKDAADLDFSRFDRRCAWRRYRGEEIVVDYDDESSDVYFIILGEVRVLIRTAAGKEIILGELKAGQFFGELAAIDGAKRSANVTALTNSEICIMPANVFREIIFSSPTISERVLRLLTGRVRELTARVTEHSVFDLKHRLYSELLRMAHPRQGRPDQRALTPPPLHHVLAARIGCRREQVTRELSALADEGLIEKTRGALVLLQPQILEKRLGEAMREGG